MMACPNMDLESRFAKLLEEADKYEIDGDVLTLFDDGKKALVFKGTKAEPLPAAEPAGRRGGSRNRFGEDRRPGRENRRPPRRNRAANTASCKSPETD